MTNTAFMPTGHGNYMARFAGFKVSFNPDTSHLGEMWAGDGAETALIVGGQYFILNGDFRTEYAALSEDGLDACMAFFLGKPELRSQWSNQP